ncbi:hypothetical protein WAI453_003365 [Rhynchosporium graminicola]
MKINSFVNVVSALLSIATVEGQFQSSKNCTIFIWDQQPAYFSSGRPERISSAATCTSKKTNKTQYCGLTENGDIQVQ